MVQFHATKICSILLRKLKLKKNVLLLSVILVHLLPACYLLHVFRRRTVAERVEDVQFAIRKSSLLEYLESTKVQLPQEGDKILWLHIPRTTADSTQTTLIGDENDRLIDYRDQFNRQANSPNSLQQPPNGLSHHTTAN